MRIPRINSVMTPFPYSVEATAGLDVAQEMMSRHRIRHLPVMDGTHLVGIVSQHAVDRARAADRRASPKVHEVMRKDPCIVEIGEPLERVLEHMADRHLECVLVVKDDRLAGIFTVVDACRRFAQELGRQRTTGGGGEVA
jgi:CBS domain-containing protein